MSEDIKPFTIIPNEVFDLDLSSLQFRFLCNFIKISKKFNGHSFFGYTELAKINQCGKAAAIKTVKELENIGVIEVATRKNSSQSNDIYLNLDKFLTVLNGGLGQPEEGYLNNTPNHSEGYLKDSTGYLKDSTGYLKDTPYIDIKNNKKKYINKNIYEGYLNDTPPAEIAAKEKKETADVAAVRTMPNIESARIEKAGNQCELETFLLADSFFKVFPDLKAWCCFEEHSKTIIIVASVRTRFGNSQFNKIFDEKRADIDKFFAEKNQKLHVFEEKPSKSRKIFIKNIEKTTY